MLFKRKKADWNSAEIAAGLTFALIFLGLATFNASFTMVGLVAMALPFVMVLPMFIRSGKLENLALCGGVLSFLVLWGLLHLPASPGEFIFTVSGALAHNIGQLLGASVLLSSAMALGYAPVLLVAGLCVGALSCVLSKALFAAMPKNAPGRVNQYKLFKK